MCKRPRKEKRKSNGTSANLIASLVSESEEDEDEILQLVDVRPKISVHHEGGVELILNLKEWLKSPYQLVNEI